MSTTSPSMAPAPPGVPGRRHGRSARRGFIPYAYLSPTIIVMTILLVVPIVLVISYSLMEGAVTSKNPAFVGLENYADILTSSKFWIALKNTAIFTSVSVVAHMVLGLAFSMLLNSDHVTRLTRTIFRTLFVLPWLLTVAIIAILWRLLLDPNGIVNYVLDTLGLTEGRVEWLSNPSLALAAVTFINIWAGYPFFMISMLAGLQGIPRDLYEAAEVDGAGAVRVFWHITLPQLRPIIVSMAMLDLIWTSQQFALIWMTTGGGPLNRTEMLSTFTYKLAFAQYDFSAASASAVVTLLLSMILAIGYVRTQKAGD